MFPLEELARTMFEHKFDSAFLIVNSPPIFTKNSSVIVVESMSSLTASDIDYFQQMLSLEYTSSATNARLSQSDFDFSIGIKDLGRYRIQGYMQRGSHVYNIKRVGGDIPELEERRIPGDIQQAILADKGLMLISGSSPADLHSAQASLVKHRSMRKTGYIVSIENPLEFMHQHSMSVIAQREIGIDVDSMKQALESAFKQNPNLISTSEIDLYEDAQALISFCESGGAAISILRSPSLIQTIRRACLLVSAGADGIVAKHALSGLAYNLRYVVCQHIITRNDGEKIPIYETLKMTKSIRDVIESDSLSNLEQVLTTEGNQGHYVNLNQALMDAYEQKLISEEDALNASADKKPLHERIRQFNDINALR